MSSVGVLFILNTASAAAVGRALVSLLHASSRGRSAARWRSALGLSKLSSVRSLRFQFGLCNLACRRVAKGALILF